MATNRLHPEVAVKLGRDNHSFVTYGNHTFAFDPSDRSGQSKSDAMRAAESFGLKWLQSLEKRLNRPLSVSEKVKGIPDVAPAPPLEGSLRPLDKPPENPYRKRQLEIEKRTHAFTETEKAVKRRRIEAYEQAAIEWDAKIAGEVARDAVSNSDDMLRARAHAEARYNELALRDDVPQEAVDSANASVEQLAKGQLSPGQYFQGLEPAPQPTHGGSLYGEQ